MSELRLRGIVNYVVPTTTDERGKRRGGFGFVRCDGVVAGELAADQPSPIGVDHFMHVRDIPEFTSIEQAHNKAVEFTPAEHPKGPRATSARTLR